MFLEDKRQALPVNHSNILIMGLTLLALTLTWACYQPGLGGAFLLDDLPNLSSLSDFNLDPTWEAASQFVFSGGSGPFGRPLSMASFLTDALSWPNDAGSFRHTNLLIHLVNGLLLLAVMLRLSPNLGPKGLGVALLTTCLWLIHPIHTATTLYVVQRMTILATTFMLMGMWIYLIGRSWAAQRSAHQGAMVMMAGLGIGAGLGVLAKENAVLMPAILLGLEHSILPHNSTIREKRWFQVSRYTLLIVPLIVIALYLLMRLPAFEVTYSWRPFSLSERLLTEPRILLEYVKTILVPATGAISLFHDGYPKSTGLIHPASTLSAIVFWFLLVLSAIQLRRVFPIVAGGLFWYLANHLLESTVVPLELYFDHRNYLASAGILWIIAYYLLAIPIKNIFVVPGTSVLLLVLYACLTYTASTSYGNPMQAAIIWTEEQPDSARVREFAAEMWFHAGDYANAERELTENARRHPTHIELWLNLAQIQCLQGRDTSATLSRALSEASNAPINFGMLDPFNNLRRSVKENRCSSLTIDNLLVITTRLLENNSFRANNDQMALLWHLRGELLAEKGEYSDAVDALEQTRRLKPEIKIRFWQYIWLISAGEMNKAKAIEETAREESLAKNATDSSINEYKVISKISEKVNRLPGSGYSLLVDPDRLERGTLEIEIRKSNSHYPKIQVPEK